MKLVFEGVFIKKKKEVGWGGGTSPEQGWKLQRQEGNGVVYFGLEFARRGKACLFRVPIAAPP